MQAVSSLKAKQKANFVFVCTVNVRNERLFIYEIYLVVGNFEMVRNN